MAFSSNALCAKAKTMYGTRLTHEIYSELIRKQTVGEVVAYLKAQTNYGDALKDINIRKSHRNQIENCLNQEYYRRCAKLMKYAVRKEEDFYMFEIVAVEIDLIVDKLAALQANQPGKFHLSIPQYLAHKTSFNIDGLVNIETYKDLLKYLEKTEYYKILKEIDFDLPLNIREIDKQLLTVYYENLNSIIKKHYKGTLQRDLLNIVYTSIELKNITKIYRCKQYFHESPESIENTLFMQYTRLPKDIIKQMIYADSPKKVLELVAGSKYHLYTDDKEYPYIEYYADNIRYNIAKRYMRFSNDAPLVYMTYCILQRIEIDNLKHIIEAIRYNQEPSRIERMLIVA